MQVQHPTAFQITLTEAPGGNQRSNPLSPQFERLGHCAIIQPWPESDGSGDEESLIKQTSCKAQRVVSSR